MEEDWRPGPHRRASNWRLTKRAEKRKVVPGRDA